jgi:Fe-S cluster biogenesis protein NfuA
VSEADWRAAGERVETLIDASAAGGAVARERAEELVRLVADLYGAGLQRLLEIAYERGALTDDVLAALAGDDLVASLLLVHGLHPYPARTRIEQALLSHGGAVQLLDLSADGVVRLRITGSHDGCGSPAPALRLAVEEAIEAAAPEVTAIEVEQSETAPVIPVSALFARLGEPGGRQEVAS